MEAIKGVARRATQAVREGLTTHQMTEEDKLLTETTAKVHQFERTGLAIGEKLTRVSRLYGELGQLLKSIADDYASMPEKCSETELMCAGLLQAGTQLVAKGNEFQATLKEHAQNPIAMFLKEIPKLKDVEDDRAKKKLEFEFFRSKVLELRKDPPKDSSRIPRNEHILENWRVELWKATETNKAAVSALFTQGRQVIDRSVLVVIQTTGNFVHSSATCLKQHLFNARLPVYPQGPVLVPSPLPPNPLPPFQQLLPHGQGPVVAQWQAPAGWAAPVNQPPPQGWAPTTPAHHLPPGTQSIPSYQTPYQQPYAQIPVAVNIPPQLGVAVQSGVPTGRAEITAPPPEPSTPPHSAEPSTTVEVVPQ